MPALPYKAMIRTGDPQTDALQRRRAERDLIYVKRIDADDPFWDFVRDRHDWDRRLRVAFVQLLHVERVITSSRHARLLRDDLLTLWGMTPHCLPVEFINFA
jgi:hypothetical protein